MKMETQKISNLLNSCEKEFLNLQQENGMLLRVNQRIKTKITRSDT